MDKRGLRRPNGESETEEQREREKEMRETKEERGDAIRLIRMGGQWVDGQMDGRTDGWTDGRMDAAEDKKNMETGDGRRETGDDRNVIGWNKIGCDLCMG